MTLLVPLDPSSSPACPSFVRKSKSVGKNKEGEIGENEDLKVVVKALLGAKRIAVVSGAGISVGAGIPDFRSSEGLYNSLSLGSGSGSGSSSQDATPTAGSSTSGSISGKDLFDASVFSSESKASLFCQMIAKLSTLSLAAQPTSFHSLLRALDERGTLLRTYTQNIDGLESKVGLSFGVPEFGVRGRRAGTKSKISASLVHPISSAQTSSTQTSSDETPSAQTLSSARTKSSPLPLPRCIPLHGTLQTLRCFLCSTSVPLEPHIPLLQRGVLPDCSACEDVDDARKAVGKRRRGVGKMRPSIVLYGEMHRDGEGIGEIVRRDLRVGVGASTKDSGANAGAKESGSGSNAAKKAKDGKEGEKKEAKGKRKAVDLLIVVGTSLKVHGTKKIVRDFSKALRSSDPLPIPPPPSPTKRSARLSQQPPTPTRRSHLPSPSPSPRRSLKSSPSPSSLETEEEEMTPPKTIFINFDFPAPAREWEGVFDVWIQGDVQKFSDIVLETIREESEKKAKRKRPAAAKVEEGAGGKGVKRKRSLKVDTKKTEMPPTPSPSPLPLKKKPRLEFCVEIPLPPHPPPFRPSVSVSFPTSNTRLTAPSLSPSLSPSRSPPPRGLVERMEDSRGGQYKRRTGVSVIKSSRRSTAIIPPSLPPLSLKSLPEPLPSSLSHPLPLPYPLTLPGSSDQSHAHEYDRFSMIPPPPLLVYDRDEGDEGDTPPSSSPLTPDTDMDSGDGSSDSSSDSESGSESGSEDEEDKDEDATRILTPSPSPMRTSRTSRSHPSIQVKERERNIPPDVPLIDLMSSAQHERERAIPMKEVARPLKPLKTYARRGVRVKQ
ncbi:DHS-like NAD/FAD-binding domain-containing protein [Sistotremastrum suecicum HHB10207 ss-3]|uniref:DHS-like NAD/FAD-binding domain-containing protein n=1 Tax=Sistotremastrum suecicum HHB10207 ss-3 TaxID=1314776 RepID=A0A166GL99_9AGAM|nr:DHS-like NAD/FAD-binding domain-containing protein [Sistotremastrum suecicum HHB10207 ss-3]